MHKIKLFTLDELVSMENFNKRIDTQNNNIDEIGKEFKKLGSTVDNFNTHKADKISHVTQFDKERWDNVKPSQNFIRNGQFNVSQRGYNCITDKPFRVFADGWHCSNSTVVTKIDQGVLITNSPSIYQGFEVKDVEILRGKTLTLSALVRPSKEGFVHVNTFSWNGEPSITPPSVGYNFNTEREYFDYIENFKKITLTLTIPIENNTLLIRFWTYPQEGLEIKDVKLEIGNVATEYQPKTYGEEFRACQRYYRETPFMVSGHITGEVASFGQSSKMMRIEPRTNVKSLNSGAVGKVDLLNGIGSGSPVDPSIIMSNVGISRVIVVLPENSTGIQGILIEDAEIY